MADAALAVGQARIVDGFHVRARGRRGFVEFLAQPFRITDRAQAGDLGHGWSIGGLGKEAGRFGVIRRQVGRRLETGAEDRVVQEGVGIAHSEKAGANDQTNQDSSVHG